MTQQRPDRVAVARARGDDVAGHDHGIVEPHERRTVDHRQVARQVDRRRQRARQDDDLPRGPGAEQSLLQHDQGIAPGAATADGPAVDLQVAQQPRADLGAAQVGQRRRRLIAQQRRPPDRGPAQHGQQQGAGQQPAQPPLAGPRTHQFATHRVDRVDHDRIVDLQRLARIGVGGEDGRRDMGIEPCDRGQGPVRQRTAGAVGHHQRGIAERHDDLAPLVVARRAPQAETFQSVVL